MGGIRCSILIACGRIGLGLILLEHMFANIGSCRAI